MSQRGTPRWWDDTVCTWGMSLREMALDADSRSVSLPDNHTQIRKLRENNVLPTFAFKSRE